LKSNLKKRKGLTKFIKYVLTLAKVEPIQQVGIGNNVLLSIEKEEVE
jgi:hypothetical protein